MSAREHINSPFHPVQGRTRAGFFSALVFRGITQSAPVVRTGNLWFNSLDDFEELKRDHPEEWMCKKNALGFPNKHRSTANAGPLWTASKQYERLFTIPKQSFMNCFNFLRSVDQPKKHIKFFGFGPLTAYLLAVDYAYAGFIELPTVDDMACIIKIIDRGGIRGLRLVGALSGGKSKATEDECIHAFRTAYTYLDITLTAEEKSATGFDIFTLEHCLCKLARLNTRLHIL